MVPRSTPVYTVLLAVIVSSHETKFTPANLRVKNPNFIVLFADDIGWGDLGANWNQHKSNTPNLDTLAKNGIRFTDFHSGASVCTPSRAALLTGRLGLRTGVTHNFQIESVGGLPLNETTFAETFKAAGYRTGMLGKWHLGVNGRYHPSHRGFDYYFGLPYSNDMGCCDNPGYDIPSCAPCPKDRHQMYNQSKYNDLLCYPQSALPLYENTTIIEQPVDIFTLSERYADKALEFIENSSQHDQPFLLYVAFAHMHVPLAHRTKFTNSSTDGIYGDTLRELDDVIGRIVQSVRKANKEQDTLIWFTGDNGSWSVKCQYGGSQGPFLGTWQKEEGGGGSSAKNTLWEAGHREPSLAYWPSRIAPGQVTDSILSAMDIFPTMASIAGIAMPPNRKYDGIDITDVLFKKKNIYDRTLFHPDGQASGPNGKLDAVRLGDYKAIFQTGGEPSCGGIVGPKHRHDPPLIFNLRKDVAESKPLPMRSEEYETIHTAVLNALEFIMDDIRKDNTSVANYVTDPSAAPCCNRKHVSCRCKD